MKKFTILIVGRDSAFSEYLEKLLSRPDRTFIHAGSFDDAERVLYLRHVDLVVLDSGVNGGSGTEFMKRALGSDSIHDISLLMVSRINDIVTNLICCDINETRFSAKTFEGSDVESGVEWAESLRMAKAAF